MKPVMLILLLAFQIHAEGTNDFPSITVNGHTYTNVFVDRFNVAYAWLYQRTGGGGMFKLSDLPPEVQERCHYDPAAEAKMNEQAKGAAEKAKSRAIVNTINDKIKTTRDPIRETVTWEPKEEINVFKDVFHAGFFAILDQRDVKFTTNGTKLSLKPLRKPDTVTMTLTSLSGEWVFLKSHDFIIVYDGERKNFGEIEHHGDVGNYGGLASVTESFFPEFTYAEFRALSAAKSVKAESAFPFELSYQDREAMRAFVNYFDMECKSETNGPPPSKSKP